MSVKVLADGRGKILYHQGDLDKKYGIASLSKVIAAKLIYERMKEIATERGVKLDALLKDNITSKKTYDGDQVYTRSRYRKDLEGTEDDPQTYRPFRSQKSDVSLGIGAGQSFNVKYLFEKALFESKNDAIQLLSDHFLGGENNAGLRQAFERLAVRLNLDEFPEKDKKELKTQLQDPHGLNDGDNTFTGRDLAKIFGAMIRDKDMAFFRRFNPYQASRHTAKDLLNNARLQAAGIKIDVAKTGQGNNGIVSKSHPLGDSRAVSLAAIGGKENGPRFSAFSLSDEGGRSGMMDTVANLLLKAPFDAAPEPETAPAASKQIIPPQPVPAQRPRPVQ